MAFKKETLSYAQLARKAEGVCRQLEAHGVAPGDAVCFSAVSRPEMVVAYLGIQMRGAVFLDKNGTPEHMAQIYHESGAKLLLTDKPMQEHGEGLCVESLRNFCARAETLATGILTPVAVKPDALAELLFTTGTTGKPKGVMLSWRAVFNILRNTIDGIHIASDTALLLPLPLNHSFALRVLRAVLYSGGTVVLQNGFTFAREVENNILSHNCNAMACVPASYEVMKSQMQDAIGPALFVAPRQGYSEAELVRFLAERLERFKLPQRYIQVLELPRNRMQKVDRNALRRMWENQDALALMNPVVEAILSRRSLRRFTDREISRDILEMLVKCGYHAPSGHNMQSWRFTVLTKHEDIQRLKESSGVASRANRVHFYGFENPQAMILISNDTRNPDGCQDASCAAENIMLAAQSYGIGSVWLNMLMKLRDAEPVKEVLDGFGIPANHSVWASIALGYPMTEGAKLKKKEDVARFI